MYLTYTRPDICFAVNTLRHVHLMVAKHILTYQKGTVDYGLKYEENQKINLEGYVDSDWVGSAIDWKSTSRCFFSMGLGVISWFNRKESCMALSTAKEKYVATCIFLYDAERSSEALVCDPDQDISKEGVLAYPMRQVV